ncbi:MAG: hypothetical protein J6386_02935 [Candidatus Synoicihabitans palmerolidicus]|nr:hypothetical protein [Candidatus Synoicihabitans palmerolidicus]
MTKDTNVSLIEHGLETPYPLEPFQNYLRLEGWTFRRQRLQASQVRIRIAEQIYAPESTRAREDVAAWYPD